MCFDIGSQHIGCWGQNTSRIQNKEVYATLCLQARVPNRKALQGLVNMVWRDWLTWFGGIQCGKYSGNVAGSSVKERGTRQRGTLEQAQQSYME